MASSKEIKNCDAGVEHCELYNLSDAAKAHMGKADKETTAYTSSAAIQIDKETNRRLLWKINGRILVVMLITYFCQSLDKGTLNFASIMGIQTDAHLVGQQVRKRVISFIP